MKWATLRWHLRRSDWVLTGALLALIVIGIFFIYSASFQRPDMPVGTLYRRQIIWAMAGIAGYIALAMTDYRRLAESAWWIYSIILVLLVLVLMIGHQVHGATRWLSVFNIQLQPAELAKLAVILAVARYWARPDRDMNSLASLAVALVIAGVPFLLIAQQPDLGTAATLVPITLFILFAGGIRMKFILLLFLIGLMLAPIGWLGLGNYQKERILVFLDSSRDPYGAGWNKIQSEIAVGSGGLTGKGYLQGTQNILGFLPRTVAPTDFIYSVIAEEKGFVGAATVLALYGIVLICGTRAALVAPDKLGRLIAVGVTGMIFFHVFVNTAMTIGLMPITGLPLPLMSYGGSFMVSMMLSFGIVQSISIRRIRR